MSDATQIGARIGRTEEDFRAFSQTVRKLEGDLADLLRSWPDLAGRDFVQRHLQPLLANLHRVREELRQQFGSLAAAVEHAKAALVALNRLRSMSEEATQEIVKAENAIAHSRYAVDHAHDAVARAMLIAAEVESQLNGLG